MAQLGAAAALVVSLVLALAGCGAATVVPADRALAPILPEPFGDTAVRLPPVGAGGLEARLDDVRSSLAARGFEIERAPEVIAGADAGLLVARDPAGTRHSVIVAAPGWSAARVDTLMGALYTAPATLDALGQASRFHVVGDEPTPFALRYLFSNSWWGVLESALFADLSDASTSPSEARPHVARVRATLLRFGIETAGADTIEVLDDLLAALPRPTDGSSEYQPIATLVAIGLVLTDELARRHARLHWLSAHEAAARYFGLGVRGTDQLLRPIDYALIAWRADSPRPLAAYVEVVEARLRGL